MEREELASPGDHLEIGGGDGDAADDARCAGRFTGLMAPPAGSLLCMPQAASAAAVGPVETSPIGRILVAFIEIAPAAPPDSDSHHAGMVCRRPRHVHHDLDARKFAWCSKGPAPNEPVN
jgi:hypothetical protein